MLENFEGFQIKTEDQLDDGIADIKTYEICE